MTDHLQDYLRQAVPVIDDDYGALQRAALEEVTRLRTDAVSPAESQIETQHYVAKRAAETRREQDEKQLRADFEATRQAVQDRHRDRVAEVRAEYASKLGALDSETDTKRSRITSNTEAREQQAEKQCEYEILLAESVADGTLKRCEQEREDIQAAVPAAKRRLEALCEQAHETFRRSRQAVPQADSDDELDSETLHDTSSFRDHMELARRYLDALGSLRLARLFVGIRPTVFVLLLCAAAVVALWLVSYAGGSRMPPLFLTAPVACAVVLVASLLVGRALWRAAGSRMGELYRPFRRAIAAAHVALERRVRLAEEQWDERSRAAIEKRDASVGQWRERFAVTAAEIAEHRDASLKEVEQAYTKARAAIEEQQDQALREANMEHERTEPQHRQEYERGSDDIRARFDRDMSEYGRRRQADQELLEGRWDNGLACIKALLDRTNQLDARLSADWSDPSWRGWAPSVTTSTSAVRFGYVELDLSQLADGVRERASFAIDPKEPVRLPALLTFPDRCSLLLQTYRHGREQAIAALRAVMVRLFTTLPPGRVQFTIIDPVALGENFAGFMHAGDYQESLIGGRIWTDAAQIHQRLTDLTDHMENVIQKYLRNEFETIEEYNLQAGELAEPYRFLVIADFPANFSDEAALRLSSIISSGARCGVYTLIAHDARQELPRDIHIEDLAANSVHLVYKDDRFVWQDTVYGRFPLVLDTPPAEATLTEIMHTVGRAAKDSTRVEVPFEIVAPPEGQYWSADSTEHVSVPIGRAGATRLQTLTLGHGVAQHLLIAGKTGSGKSTLLHVIITNLALWYAPDQMELYLIDFKRGVEFKTYATHHVPHIRTVAIESDREFGLSILQRLDAEMARRGALFRDHGVQDVASYRQATGAVLPRTVLIVDEFQIFFSEDDKLAQDAGLLLEQLVRQGRAFGIHVILGSQTLGGTSGLARSTIGQMAVRIALQCSEADSQLILDDDNVAGRLLSRPGEAIYNDAGGMVIGNSPFQTAWLPDNRRDHYLDHVACLATDRKVATERTVVFEGNAPGDITTNHLLAERLAEPSWPSESDVRPAWVGEAVAIKDPTAVSFPHQSGANLLIIGQRDTAALGVASAALVSLAAQHDPQSARFVILDGTPANSSQTGELQRVVSAFPHNCQLVPWRNVPDVMAELGELTRRRQQDNEPHWPAVYVLVYALQRYRMLRRKEDDFGLVSDDEDAAARPDREFVEILRDGPPVGVHVLAWADTLAAVERTLDRQTLREFDNRVLFQMSAADSSYLIDSPVANQLGLQRALLDSEEHGLLERFRPYAPLDPAWLDHVAKRLASKA